MKSDSSPLTVLTSLTKHKGLEDLGFGSSHSLPGQVLRGREHLARWGPCRDTLAAATGGLGSYRAKRTPRGSILGRPHRGQAGTHRLLPRKPRPASPTSLFLRHLLLAQDRPWRAGSSLGRLPLQLFLTQIRRQQAPGSTGEAAASPVLKTR